MSNYLDQMLYFIADFGSFDSDDRSSNMMTLKRKLKYCIGDDDTLILGGDNFYPNGIQTRTDLDTLIEFFSDLPCKIHGVLGNHDYYGYIRPQTECERLGINTFTQVLSISDDLGLCLINTPIMCKHFCEDPGMWTRNHSVPLEQLKYEHIREIDDALSHMPVQCTYMIGHYPMFSDGFYGDNMELQMLLLPLILKHNIYGYICGHEHNMQVHEFGNAYLKDLVKEWATTGAYSKMFRDEPQILSYYTKMLNEMDTWCYTWGKFTHIICGSAAEKPYRVKPGAHCVQYNTQNNMILALDPNGKDYTFICT